MATCMRSVTLLSRKSQLSLPLSNSSLRPLHASQQLGSRTLQSSETPKEEGEFRVYQIEGLKRPRERKRWEQILKRMSPPRFRTMSTDQDWTDVWPTAATFKWSTVPFPVRQGFIESSVENEGVAPSKYANFELMKIPNFLHLTPAHIKKHCAALKKFCNDWPEGLETDEKCRLYFPLQSSTSDFIYSAPTMKDERARVASINFKLSDLKLDYHARDKFLRLVGDRYDRETDEVCFESDRCPLKSQNLDYVNFLLTAVYFESWKREDWESLKELDDMEKYFWDLNKSKKNLIPLLKTIKDADQKSDSTEGRLDYLPEDIGDEEQLCKLPEIESYKVAVEDLFNEGENIETLNNYKNAVTKLFNLKSDLA